MFFSQLFPVCGNEKHPYMAIQRKTRQNLGKILCFLKNFLANSSRICIFA